MTTDVVLTDLVDLDRYPLMDLDCPNGADLLRHARTQLARTGYAELPGFVNSRGVAALVTDAESMKERAHRSSGIGTAYLEVPDRDLDRTHPRRWLGRYSVGAVSYDLVPRESPLRRLYEWEALTGLLPV
jgi:hypothetical protein